MRKSFWELATKFSGFYEEMLAIDQLFDAQTFSYRGNPKPFTIKQYIDSLYFSRWASSNSITAISIKDLMQGLGIDFFDPRSYKTDFSLEEFLLYVETIYNLVSIRISCTQEIMDTIFQIRRNIETDCTNARDRRDFVFSTLNSQPTPSFFPCTKASLSGDLPANPTLNVRFARLFLPNFPLFCLGNSLI